MTKGLKTYVEYFSAKFLLELFGRMPKRIAYRAAGIVAWLGFHLAKRQRNVGLHNLAMVFPNLGAEERTAILRGSFSNLGRLLVEFSHFRQLKASNIAQLVRYEGYEHFENALNRGNGVLFLTAHIGAWELSSFAHSIYGHPMKFLVREIDNPLVEELISSYRCLGGNVPIVRQNSARGILKTLRANETIGILVDQNTLDGVFVDFLGIPAATTPSVATLALRTGATVIPGFLIWDAVEQIHRLCFEPPIELVETADLADSIVENTRLFNQVVERYVKKYPEQWLWIHRRWKTRPPGEPPIYG
ncbi:MAG TPA: lysophospholipid acyltransferase family protein [Terriglobia bacterium]|nr:lysophospholipid acyltransferase family protein [Terriglobia bacterium]